MAKMETVKPEKGGPFDLKPCRKCGTDDAVYVKMSMGGVLKFRARCRFCGERTGWKAHIDEAKAAWNGEVQTHE